MSKLTLADNIFAAMAVGIVIGFPLWHLAEVPARRARMNPHFSFNALNALAALSTVAPRKVPQATVQQRQFVQTSLDQHQRIPKSLEEQLAVIHTYLDIESLQMGSRLKIEQIIDPGPSKTLNAALLVPTAGGERGAAWNPIPDETRPATHHGPYGRKMLPRTR
jgi:uncharacterized membrane protein YhiD involved in acid resistance